MPALWTMVATSACCSRVQAFADGGTPDGKPGREQVFDSLGIQIERMKPACPQQNGRHERMHLTLKQEATKPASANLLQQQARFDTFVAQYNCERPHQALDMAVPAARYVSSVRPYRGLEDLTYPLHDWTATVTNCGRVCFKNRKVNLSQVFAGQNVGASR